MEKYEEDQHGRHSGSGGCSGRGHEAQKGAWGVVTSAPGCLRNGVWTAQAFHCPRVLVPVDEIERGKPDPEGYLKAAKLLRVEPADCVVFEDTRPGIESAEAAGMTAIGLMTTFPAETLGLCLDDSGFSRHPFGTRVERGGEGFRIFTASLQ